MSFFWIIPFTSQIISLYCSTPLRSSFPRNCTYSTANLFPIKMFPFALLYSGLQNSCLKPSKTVIFVCVSFVVLKWLLLNSFVYLTYTFYGCGGGVKIIVKFKEKSKQKLPFTKLDQSIILLLFSFPNLSIYYFNSVMILLWHYVFGFV